MPGERTTQIVNEHTERGNSKSVAPASMVSSLYEILRANPDANLRKNSATHLLKLAEEGQDIDGGEIEKLFNSERDIGVATELKRVLNKLEIRAKFIDDPTAKFDRKLTSEEEAKVYDAIDKLKSLYDKSKGTSGAFDTKYQTTGEVARGGMGRICKALRLEDKQIVAVKFLLLEELSKENDPTRIVGRFKREGEILSRLNHLNIVKAFEHGEAGGGYFIVMEYVDGETVEDRIVDKPLEFKVFKEIGLQLCDAVQYAHENGIIHRDIKPANIMLKGENGGLQVKLCDFGLAKDKKNPKLSKFAFTAGTDDYVSPQQARDARDADERDDIYSMGKTFYEMLPGRAQKDNEPYTEIEEVDAKKARNINEVIKKCVSPERRDRWQRVGELRSALEKC